MAMTKINASSVAIVCPTKDQPVKIKRLLTCIEHLNTKPAQVLIADGGNNLKAIVEGFKKNINVICLDCPEAGQILQRNYAHQHLDDHINLVLHIDDDITFEPDFMDHLLATWNREVQSGSKPLAGMSFNVVDASNLKNSIFRRLFFLSIDPPGHVSKAGYAAPFSPLRKDHDVSWLTGGTTAWARAVLHDNLHPLSFQTRWAVCEDLMFSYPLRHDYRLLAAHDVKCFHNETYASMSFKKAIFYGRSSAIMRYHFICQHDDLKTWAYIWMTFGVLLGHFIKGLMFSPRHLGLFVGGIKGLFQAIFASATNGDSAILARNLTKD